MSGLKAVLWCISPLKTPGHSVFFHEKACCPKSGAEPEHTRTVFFCPDSLEKILADKPGTSSREAVFALLNAELQRAYGRPFNWDEITNPSGSPEAVLSQSMVARGIVLTEAYPPADTCREGEGTSENGHHTTGSIWICPDTHQVMQRNSDGQIRQSDSLYAVGAMIRGQIIDASMAESIVRSVSNAAAHLFETAGSP